MGGVGCAVGGVGCAAKTNQAYASLDGDKNLTKLMSMKAVNIGEAKAGFSGLVEAAQRGETVLICKRNIPVAKLEAAQSGETQMRHRTQIGWARGTGVRIHGDVTAPAIAESDWAMHG